MTIINPTVKPGYLSIQLEVYHKANAGMYFVFGINKKGWGGHIFRMGLFIVDLRIWWVKF